MGKINVAIMGTGNMASVMARTLRKVRGVRLYAVASRTLNKAADFAKQYGFKKAYGSYEELVQDDRVGLVYIATPHSEHYSNAKLCIEKGRAVLVEKAFTANAKQAKELIALAEEKHVFLTEAIWVRYMPFVRKMKDVLDSGIIGKPVMLTANLGYDVHTSARMREPELAGGSLLDLGIYPISFASMMFGDDVLKISAACSYTDRHVDEQDTCTFVYRDGKVASLSATMLGLSDRQGVITGTRGYMVVQNINNFEALTVYDNTYKRVAYYKRPRQKTGYEYEIQACVKALKEGRTECEEMPHSETVRILQMMDYIRAQLGIVYPFEEPEDIGLTEAVRETGAIEEKQAETAAAGEQDAAAADGPKPMQIEEATTEADSLEMIPSDRTLAGSVVVPFEEIGGELHEEGAVNPENPRTAGMSGAEALEETGESAPAGAPDTPDAARTEAEPETPAGQD